MHRGFGVHHLDLVPECETRNTTIFEHSNPEGSLQCAWIVPEWILAHPREGSHTVPKSPPREACHRPLKIHRGLHSSRWGLLHMEWYRGPDSVVLTFTDRSSSYVRSLQRF